LLGFARLGFRHATQFRSASLGTRDLQLISWRRTLQELDLERRDAGNFLEIVIEGDDLRAVVERDGGDEQLERAHRDVLAPACLTHGSRPCPQVARRRSESEGQKMNEQNARAELFEALRSLAEIVPQMRAGQLMAALGELCADLHGRGLWDIDDADLLEAIWQFRRGIEDAAVGAGQQQIVP